MKQAEKSDPDVWKYFEEGNFSVQKSENPAVAIDCDHAGEQARSEDKSRGGQKGSTHNQNSLTRYSSFR